MKCILRLGKYCFSSPSHVFLIPLRRIALIVVICLSKRICRSLSSARCARLACAFNELMALIRRIVFVLVNEWKMHCRKWQTIKHDAYVLSRFDAILFFCCSSENRNRDIWNISTPQFQDVSNLYLMFSDVLPHRCLIDEDLMVLCQSEWREKKNEWWLEWFLNDEYRGVGRRIFIFLQLWTIEHSFFNYGNSILYI